MLFKRLFPWIVIGSLTITIPDAKDPFVVAAKDAYNTRTGSSLTLAQYVEEVLRRSAINELTTERQTSAQATITADDAACKAKAVESQQAVEDYFDAQLNDWPAPASTAVLTSTKTPLVAIPTVTVLALPTL